jgi:hypothetical protein
MRPPAPALHPLGRPASPLPPPAKWKYAQLPEELDIQDYERYCPQRQERSILLVQCLSSQRQQTATSQSATHSSSSIPRRKIPPGRHHVKHHHHQHHLATLTCSDSFLAPHLNFFESSTSRLDVWDISAHAHTPHNLHNHHAPHHRNYPSTEMSHLTRCQILHYNTYDTKAQTLPSYFPQ